MKGPSDSSKSRENQSSKSPENVKTKTGPSTEKPRSEKSVEKKVEVKSKKTTVEEVSDSEDEEIPEWRRKAPKSPGNRQEKQELPFKDVPPVLGTPSEQVRAEVKKQVRFEPDVEKKSEPNYRRKAPVEEQASVEKLTESLLKQQVSVSLGDLAGVSPLVRESLRHNFTRRRIVQGVFMVEEVSPSLDSSDEARIDTVSEDGVHKAFPLPTVSVNMTVGNGLPIGAIIVSDPLSQYLEGLDEEGRKKIVVAKDSEALRTVWPVVNGEDKEECIVDWGSQIVAMATDVAVSLGISWDPDRRINMQSANGQVELSAGLARNVAFKFGEITVYLQVHIINRPAYRILLGRPFEVLTKTITESSPDGNQVLTITDPNTGSRVVVPTFERGKGPGSRAKKDQTEGFH
jgi:hypothetical protein